MARACGSYPQGRRFKPYHRYQSLDIYELALIASFLASLIEKPHVEDWHIMSNKTGFL